MFTASIEIVPFGLNSARRQPIVLRQMGAESQPMASKAAELARTLHRPGDDETVDMTIILGGENNFRTTLLR